MTSEEDMQQIRVIYRNEIIEILRSRILTLIQYSTESQ